jgi:hypothetical protein
LRYLKPKGERITKFGIIGAAALSIDLAGPAIAYDGYRSQDPYTQAFRRHHDMRAQVALHVGTDIYARYHSGWGGPYGDGNYPGTIDENMGPPYWGRR